MASQRFPPRLRLRTNADFERVYEKRCSASDAFILVYVRSNELGHPRLGLSVSRKVGNAVARNRWKRLLREAFRLSLEELPTAIDLVVIPRPSAEPTLAGLKASLVRQSQRATEKLQRR